MLGIFHVFLGLLGVLLEFPWVFLGFLSVLLGLVNVVARSGDVNLTAVGGFVIGSWMSFAGRLHLCDSEQREALGPKLLLGICMRETNR